MIGYGAAIPPPATEQTVRGHLQDLVDQYGVGEDESIGPQACLARAAGGDWSGVRSGECSVRYGWWVAGGHIWLLVEAATESADGRAMLFVNFRNAEAVESPP